MRDLKTDQSLFQVMRPKGSENRRRVGRSGEGGVVRVQVGGRGLGLGFAMSR